MYLINYACCDQTLYEIHIHEVSNILLFSLTHDLWPWITFNGQIKVVWVFNWLYLLNRACDGQSLYETHIVSHIWYLSWLLKRSNQCNWVFNGLYLLNGVCYVFNGLYLRNRACYDKSLYQTYTESHSGCSVDLHDLWPWMTFKGRTTFNRLHIINGTSYNQSLYETPTTVSHTYKYGLSVYLIIFDLGWHWKVRQCQLRVNMTKQG